MARIYPDPISPDTESPAEREMYGLLRDQLDDSFIVMHAVSWIARDATSGAHDGETDFVIAHPQHGVLIIEVKGGEIRLDHKTQAWTSTSKKGETFSIKDPFDQARDSTYALLDKLKDKKAPTEQYYWPVYYAVAFPDVGLSSDLRPDAPRDIIIDQPCLANLKDTVLAIFEYWKGEQTPPAFPGKAGIESLVAMLAPNWHLRSPMSLAFERESEQIKELTERQFMALDLLSRHRRVAIVGGAGTGKTMLAVEKARRMAEEGFDVLFVCFNRGLCDWLHELLGANENILVTTFHGLCGKAVHWAGIPMPDGPKDQSFYDEKLPDALMRAIDKMDRRFDAIIVDEGQDFEEDWWLSLDALLRDDDPGVFYVFFDDNQRIYTELKNIPIEGEPFILDKNCRNTQGIHVALEPYSQAHYHTTCLGPQGQPVRVIPADEGEAPKALKKALLQLVDEEGVDPAHIVVLTPRSQEKSQWSEGDRMGTLMLTWNMETSLKKAIRVSTVHSFKGLESPVIILTEMQEAKSDEVVYVGLSRARNYVIVIGALPEPKGKGKKDGKGA